MPDESQNINTEPQNLSKADEVKIAEPPKSEPKPSNQPQPKTIEKIIYRQDPNIIKNLLNKARATIQNRKRIKLDKIIKLFEAKPQIANKDIQKLLHARKRTVTNYLNQLETENKIIQIGKTGKGVLYVKKP